MIADKESFLADFKESFTIYYDVFPAEASEELPLQFRADYHSRGEKYILVKEAQIWAAETNEYVYVFYAPSFDADTVRRCIDHALEDGLPRIKPHKEHMYTYIVAEFIADELGEDIKKVIKKSRFYKNYKLSLHGFSALKAAGLDLGTEKIVTNKIGHDLTKFFKAFIKKHQEKMLKE